MSVCPASPKNQDDVNPLAPVDDCSLTLNPFPVGVSLTPLPAASPEVLDAAAAAAASTALQTAAAAASVPLSTAPVINQALSSASAVKRTRSSPAQLRNPTPLTAVKEVSSGDSSHDSAESQSHILAIQQAPLKQEAPVPVLLEMPVAPPIGY
eukprot:1122173-Amphidinium_carterae.1